MFTSRYLMHSWRRPESFSHECEAPRMSCYIRPGASSTFSRRVSRLRSIWGAHTYNVCGTLSSPTLGRVNRLEANGFCALVMSRVVDATFASIHEFSILIIWYFFYIDYRLNSSIDRWKIENMQYLTDYWKPKDRRSDSSSDGWIDVWRQ